MAFSLFVNLLLRHMNATGIGASITENRLINNKAFADDIAIVIHSATDAGSILDRLSQFCEWSGMEINLLKTQVTVIDHGTMDVPADMEVERTALSHNESNVRSKPRDVCSLRLNWDRLDFIPQDKAFCYLGFDLTLTGSWKSEITKIRNKTLQLCEVLNKHKYTDSQGVYLFNCSVV